MNVRVKICREPYTTLMREAVHSRYSLLPYVYTLFKEASVTGVPLMRPLWMEFPEDISTFERDEEFLLGPSLLVHGVYSQVLYILSMMYQVKAGRTFYSRAILIALSTGSCSF